MSRILCTGFSKEASVVRKGVQERFTRMTDSVDERFVMLGDHKQTVPKLFEVRRMKGI